MVDYGDSPNVEPEESVRCTIKVLRNGEHKRIDVLNKTAVRALKRYYVEKFGNNTGYWQLKRRRAASSFASYVKDQAQVLFVDVLR